MGLEDKHLDVLQNIETVIVTIDRQEDALKDLNAIRALEALIDHFRKKLVGAVPSTPDLAVAEQAIFDGVLEVFKLRKEVSSKGDDPSPPQRRFSKALRQPSPEEITLACLRKLRKSAKRWNKNYGERGYLNFIGETM